MKPQGIRRFRNLAVAAALSTAFSLLLFTLFATADDDPGWTLTAPLPEGRIGPRAALYVPTTTTPVKIYVIGGTSDQPISDLKISVDLETDGSIQYWAPPTPTPTPTPSPAPTLTPGSPSLTSSFPMTLSRTGRVRPIYYWWMG